MHMRFVVSAECTSLIVDGRGEREIGGQSAAAKSLHEEGESCSNFCLPQASAATNLSSVIALPFDRSFPICGNADLPYQRPANMSKWIQTKYLSSCTDISRSENISLANAFTVFSSGSGFDGDCLATGTSECRPWLCACDLGNSHALKYADGKLLVSNVDCFDKNLSACHAISDL
jgi:hypothetical protein